MRLFFLFLFIVTSINAKAEFLIGFGPAVKSKFLSREKSEMNGDTLMKGHGGGGIGAQAEFKGFNLFSFVAGFYAHGSGGTGQYQFVSSTGTTDSGALDNLGLSQSDVGLNVGLRLYPLSLGIIHFFGGGGVEGGVRELSWDKDEYRSRKGLATDGSYLTSDSGAYSGWYAEGGILLKGEPRVGVEIKGEVRDMMSSVFQTLNGKRFSYKDHVGTLRLVIQLGASAI